MGDKPGATPAALKVDPKDTIFAKIVDGSIPAEKIFEDDRAIAFHDISPQAPTHILIIPKTPLGGIGDMKQEQEALVGHLMYVATQVARKQGLGEEGYRLVINEGPNGQQSVRWLHIHLLGGRKMSWPPG